MDRGIPFDLLFSCGPCSHFSLPWMARASSWASYCSDCRRHSRNERLGFFSKGLWLMIIRNYSYKFLVVTLIESLWVVDFFWVSPKSRVILNQFILTQKLLTNYHVCHQVLPTQNPHGWTLRHDGFPIFGISPSTRCPFSAKSFESLTAFGVFFFVGNTCFSFKKSLDLRWDLPWGFLQLFGVFSVYPCWTLKCKGFADDSIPWKLRKSI